MTELIITGIGAIATLISAYFAYKSKKNSDVQKQINKEKENLYREKIKETEEKLVKAMESDITAVPLLRKQLEEFRKQLKKIISIFMIVLIPSFLLTGCWTWKDEQPMIIGERIFKPNPGDVVTIPALKPPAKQWYLIDDKAMLEVLGVNKPVVPEITTGTIVK